MFDLPSNAQVFCMWIALFQERNLVINSALIFGANPSESLLVTNYSYMRYSKSTNISYIYQVLASVSASLSSSKSSATGTRGLTTGRGFGRGRRPNSSRLGAGKSVAGGRSATKSSYSSESDGDLSRFLDPRFTPRPLPLPRSDPLLPRAVDDPRSSPSPAFVFPLPLPLAFGFESSLFFLFSAGRGGSAFGLESLASSSSPRVGVADLRCPACCLRKSETTCWRRLLAYACRGAAFAPSGRSK